MSGVIRLELTAPKLLSLCCCLLSAGITLGDEHDCDPQFSTLKNKYGETDGAAEPYISIVDVTKAGVQLNCDVRGAFPQPKLQWLDSDGNVLPADEPRVSERRHRYDVTLQIIVNRTATNCFCCVVKQKDIGHMVEANFTVPEKLFEDASCKGKVMGWIGGLVLGAFIIVAVLFLLVFAKFITINRYKGSHEKTKCSCDGYAEVTLNPYPITPLDGAL